MKSFMRFLSFAFCFGLRPSVGVFGAPTIVVEKAPVTVFGHTQRCENMDLPDAPMRAFRRDDGTVVAFASHYLNRSLAGPSLSKLSHGCQLAYEGQHLADPARFDDRTWITATWTADGVNVAALGHNEYQAANFPGRCPPKIPDECKYYSIVPLRSVDGGRSFFRQNYPEPVAASSTKYDAEPVQPRGYLSPSNIIFSHDYYYTLIARSAAGGRPAGRCLFRTDTVTDPRSWTAWDGDAYVAIPGSPYEHDQNPTTACQSVLGLPGFLGSIAKIKGTAIFAAFTIGESQENVEQGYVDVSFSADLLLWTGTQHILSVTPAWSKVCPEGARYSYPGVLSDSDEGRNFETIGGTAWLFITKISCLHALDRELVRYPITVSFGTSGELPASKGLSSLGGSILP